MATSASAALLRPDRQSMHRHSSAYRSTYYLRARSRPYPVSPHAQRRLAYCDAIGGRLVELCPCEVCARALGLLARTHYKSTVSLGTLLSCTYVAGHRAMVPLALAVRTLALSPEPKFEGVNSEGRNRVGLQHEEECCGPRRRAYSLPQPAPLDVGRSGGGGGSVSRHTIRRERGRSNFSGFCMCIQNLLLGLP